ncbi:SUZ domain protein [Ceratobasidium sp. AG-Ba]|nr:SUZ domain protein [Ceratobasidium sp. AG-Ba]
MSRPSLGPQSDQLSAPQSCPSSTIPSPAPSTEASFATSNTTPLSEIGVRGDEPDPTIIEALGTKDRLFVLKLGDEFEKLLNERGSTPGKRCTYSVASSYQRMLVHRCAQYYRLTVEVEGKTIAVSVGQESRVPKSRIAEIAPQEKTAAPAFKIMRRNADERVRAKQPGRSDSTEDDQGDGTAATDEAKRRTQMTIEERTAAYEQARSRIFEGFQEKEAQPSPPRPSVTRATLRADGLTSSGDPTCLPPLAAHPHRKTESLFQRTTILLCSLIPTRLVARFRFNPPFVRPFSRPADAVLDPQYDPRQGPPGMQMYPPPPQGTYPSFPPQHAATWPQMQHAQPPPPMQFQPQPQSQGQLMSPPVDAQRYAFPPMTPTQQQQGRPAPSMPPPMPPQMQGHMQMMPQQQNDPFPPAQYMQPYQYGGMMHQPVLVPTPTDGPSSAHSSRSVSRNGHGQGPGSVGSNGGGAKGPRGSGHPSPWSSVSTVATPMRNVTGMGRRLSASSSSTSAYSSSGGGPGSGSRTPADETASVASSTSSSSSRRTYTSTSTTSKHPLPPRPDWAVGLIPDPPLSRTTSSSSTDSRLRLGSRSSSGNQIPRASSVKHSVANASDFPPLNGNGNSNGGMNGGIRAGAWVRDGSPASLFGNAPNPMAVGIGPNNSSTGSLNTTSSGGNVPPNANASANPHRFDATEGFGRPPPKSFGLYNPGTGTGPAALPVQVRSVQEGGSNPSPSATSGDALADQVAKLSVVDGDKAA